MRTDRFTDIIRRKLESIRPDFTEKDWVRMQATLQQATPPLPDSVLTGPSVVRQGWLGQPWFLAAAAVSTVVLVTFTVWQRQQISELRQTVRQLTRQQASALTPAATEPGQMAATTPAAPWPGPTTGTGKPADPANIGQPGQIRPDAARPDAARPDMTQPIVNQSTITQRSSPGRRPDTVYITRYVPAPTRPRLTEADRLTQRVTTPTERSDETDEPASLENNRQQTMNPANAPTGHIADAPGKNQRPADQVQNAARGQNPLATTGTSTSPVNMGQPVGKVTRQPDSGQYESVRRPGNEPKALLTDQQTNAGTLPTKAGVSDEVNPLTVQYEFVAGRPAQFQTIDWAATLLRRATVTKPVRTVTVGGQAPQSQPVERVAARFRLGGGTDVSKKLWSFGAFTDVVIGKNWTLNLGLSQATRKNGTFETDKDYFMQTHGNFRKEYARSIPPGYDILAIGLRMERIQMPVTVGYRIPVTRNLTVLPSVGTNLNLRSIEFVTFYKRIPFYGGGYEAVNNGIARPVDVFTDITVGTAIEWQQKHWVAQAGPVLTAPLQADAKWQTALSAGLRARVFYQF